MGSLIVFVVWMLSHVLLFVTPGTLAHQGISKARTLEWVAISFFRGSS